MGTASILRRAILVAATIVGTWVAFAQYRRRNRA